MRVFKGLMEKGGRPPLPLLRLAVPHVDFPLPRAVHLDRLLRKFHSGYNRSKRPHVNLVIPQRRVADIISPLRPLDINAVQYHFSLSLDSLDQAFTISATIIMGIKIVIILEFKGLTAERRGLPLPALLQGIPPPFLCFSCSWFGVHPAFPFR